MHDYTEGRFHTAYKSNIRTWVQTARRILHSTKGIKKQIQRRTRDDRVFLGLIRKVDEGAEDDVIGGPSDVENLGRPDLPSAIWEALETYSDVFPSELPKGVPPIRMDHESRSILRTRLHPSIDDFTNSVHSSSQKLKIRSKRCWSTSSSAFPILLMAPLCYSYPRKMAAFGFALITIGSMSVSSGIGIL